MTETKEIPQRIVNRRVKCPTCKRYCDIRDGMEVGGLAGIYYNVCHGCGWQNAIIFRAKKEKL